MDIADNLHNVLKTIPSNVQLIAVSKTYSPELILDVYNAGQRLFGENKPQELKAKFDILPKDIKWHMIGHLQTNKVKLIAPFVSLIHAVDSIKLLKTINSEAKNNNRIIDILFQIYIAKEESKFGLTEIELVEILKSDDYDKLHNINPCGLMGMASFTDDSEVIENEFHYLKDLFSKIKDSFFINRNDFCELSMGMSGDYLLAINEGSTMIRIGSAIFGDRNYL